jgi:hypothetical protein
MFRETRLLRDGIAKRHQDAGDSRSAVLVRPPVLAAQNAAGETRSLRRLGKTLTNVFVQVGNIDEYTPLVMVTNFATVVATYTEGFCVIYEVLRLSAIRLRSCSVLSQPADNRGGDARNEARLQLSCMDASLAIRPIFERFKTVVITSGPRFVACRFSTTRTERCLITSRHTVSAGNVFKDSRLQPHRQRVSQLVARGVSATLLDFPLVC